MYCQHDGQHDGQHLSVSINGADLRRLKCTDSEFCIFGKMLTACLCGFQGLRFHF